MSDDNKDTFIRNNSNAHLNRWCALPDPYPEPRVLRPNHNYALLLLEDYAGSVSEMTAINQYFYHHQTFEEKHENLAELEECISIIEMYHLELLGETIQMLGLPPKYWTLNNNRPTYWNASYVFYGKNVCDRLFADINAEEKAIKQYRLHQKLIDDPFIKDLLERIIMDEEHHLKLLREAAAIHCPDI